MKNLIRFPVERTRLPRDCTLDEFMVRNADSVEWGDQEDPASLFTECEETGTVLTEKMLQEAMESFYHHDLQIFLDTKFGIPKPPFTFLN